jgi:DNA-directed RNA polymerase sigma subunit (sigma70/sigma32)
VCVDPEEDGRLAASAPTMTDAEAAERVGLAQEGNLRARTELMASHRLIVAKLAKAYVRTGLSLDERIRFGKRGLVLAIAKFTPAKGFSFSTYATWWVRKSITKGLGGPDGPAGVREPRTPQPSSGSGSAAPHHPDRTTSYT